MSIRRGYYWIGGGRFDGPFQTVKEAKENASQLAPSIEISIRVVLASRRMSYPSQSRALEIWGLRLDNGP